MDRKRPRLSQSHDLARRLAGIGGVSATVLADIVRELRRAPVDDAELVLHRHAIGDALLERFDALHYVVEVPVVDGGEPFQWEMVDPAKLLAETVRLCSATRAAFTEAFAARPPSQDDPWDLIIGFDEFSPGNKLQVDNRRKVCGCPGPMHA
jgi:hypothetical protein